MEDKTLDDPIVREIDELEGKVATSLIDELTPTDEPEEISEAEAAISDIPTQPADNEVAAIATLVCDVCLELNLTQRSTIICKRCGESFCFHYTSNVDADYCINCMSDVSVTKSVITKTYESTGEDGEKHFYRRRARDIKIDGLDWLFTQRKIPEYSDAELELTIEYHHARLGLMLAETEKRRTEKMHRYAGVKVVIPTTSGTATTSTTTVKKTRVISKNKANEQIAALAKSLLAQGISLDQIIAKIGGKK